MKPWGAPGRIAETLLGRWRGLGPAQRDHWLGAAFTAVGLAALGLGAWSGWYMQRVPNLLAVVFAGTALGFARRRPWPVLLLVCSVYPFVYHHVDQDYAWTWTSVPWGVVPGLHLLPITLAVYVVASRGRPAPGWAVPVGFLGALLLYTDLSELLPTLSELIQSGTEWTTFDLTNYRVFDPQTGLVLVVAATLLGAASRRRRGDAEALAAHAAELERLRGVEAAEIVALERVRIAREVHDVVAHHVTAMVIRAQAAVRVQDTDPDEALRAAAWIARDGQEALSAMRHVVRVLRTAGDQEAATVPALLLSSLEDMAARLGDLGVRVDAEVGALGALPPHVELAAVRIVQEALTNVLLHAGASRVRLQLSRLGGDRVDDELRVDVEDDGRGPGPEPEGTGPGAAGGHGLVGMRERAHSLGGSLEAGAGRGGGWVVRARLPIAVVLVPEDEEVPA